MPQPNCSRRPRTQIEALFDALIDALDEIDGDADLEPCEAGDDDLLSVPDALLPTVHPNLTGRALTDLSDDEPDVDTELSLGWTLGGLSYEIRLTRSVWSEQRR